MIDQQLLLDVELVKLKISSSLRLIAVSNAQAIHTLNMILSGLELLEKDLANLNVPQYLNAFDTRSVRPLRLLVENLNIVENKNHGYSKISESLWETIIYTKLLKLHLLEAKLPTLDADLDDYLKLVISYLTHLLTYYNDKVGSLII